MISAQHITAMLMSTEVTGPKHGPVTITLVDIQERFCSIKNWTSLGHNMIHTYWLKNLTALHECLEWLTEDWTVLIPKDPPEPASEPHGSSVQAS